MTRLYLTRHGQTEWNLEGRMQGSKESALTSLGRKQALQLGKWLENTQIDVVYSSSSQRAFHTAALIIGERDVQIHPVDALVEMNLGIWEGRKWDEIRELYGEQLHLFWNAPHLLDECPGETFESLRNRVVGAIQQILAENDGKHVLVVAHAIVLKMLLSHFENRSLDQLFDDRILQPTSLSIVDVDGAKNRILQYGDTAHYTVGVEEAEE